jgi:hypothetical protein
MNHGLRQFFGFRPQGCFQLRKTLPVGDQIVGVDPVAAQHSGESGLNPRAQRLPLLLDFPQAIAAGGLFLDQRGDRFPPITQRGGEDPAAIGACESRIIRGENAYASVVEKSNGALTIRRVPGMVKSRCSQRPGCPAIKLPRRRQAGLSVRFLCSRNERV